MFLNLGTPNRVSWNGKQKNLMKRSPEQVRSEEAAAPGNDQIDEPPAEGETVHVDQPPN